MAAELALGALPLWRHRGRGGRGAGRAAEAARGARGLHAPDGRVAYSDDGARRGARRWRSGAQEATSATEEGCRPASAVGLPRSVVAVMARGYVYRTDDGGETWALAGEVPVPYTITYVKGALLDVEGRLVVAAPGSGLENPGRRVPDGEPAPRRVRSGVPEALARACAWEPQPDARARRRVRASPARLAGGGGEGQRVRGKEAARWQCWPLVRGLCGHACVRCRHVATGGGRLRRARGGGRRGRQRPVHRGAVGGNRDRAHPAGAPAERDEGVAQTSTGRRQRSLAPGASGGGEPDYSGRNRAHSIPSRRIRPRSV